MPTHSLDQLWLIMGIDTNIEVVSETTMTEIEVSISILSWWNQIDNE